MISDRHRAGPLNIQPPRGSTPPVDMSHDELFARPLSGMHGADDLVLAALDGLDHVGDPLRLEEADHEGAELGAVDGVGGPLRGGGGHVHGGEGDEGPDDEGGGLEL